MVLKSVNNVLTKMFCYLILMSVIIKNVAGKDFFIGMYKKTDILVAQDLVYKDRTPFGNTIAKYGKRFTCPIVYFRVADRLGMSPGPKVKVIRGGLLKKYIVAKLWTYNTPIAVNIQVACVKPLYKKKTKNKESDNEVSAADDDSEETTTAANSDEDDETKAEGSEEKLKASGETATPEEAADEDATTAAEGEAAEGEAAEAETTAAAAEDPDGEAKEEESLRKGKKGDKKKVDKKKENKKKDDKNKEDNKKKGKKKEDKKKEEKKGKESNKEE